MVRAQSELRRTSHATLFDQGHTLVRVVIGSIEEGGAWMECSSCGDVLSAIEIEGGRMWACSMCQVRLSDGKVRLLLDRARRGMDSIEAGVVAHVEEKKVARSWSWVEWLKRVLRM